MIASQNDCFYCNLVNYSMYKLNQWDPTQAVPHQVQHFFKEVKNYDILEQLYVLVMSYAGSVEYLANLYNYLYNTSHCVLQKPSTSSLVLFLHVSKLVL